LNINDKAVKEALRTAIDHSVYSKEGKNDKTRKFDETIDMVINVRDVDIKNPSNRIDQEYLLPHPIKGNKANVCFIVKDDMEMLLKEKGYAVVNPDQLEDLFKKPNKDKKQFVKKYDYFVARGDLMRNVAKVLARFLGQQGKMPKPLPKGYGVINPNENLDEYLPKLERIITLTMKKQLLLQVKIGKKSQTQKELMENIDSVLGFLEHQLPSGYNNIKSVYIKTSMGKPVKVKDTGKGKK
jgi:large subunit ribosomal protein L1